jgi:hypothetical protein
MSRIEPKQSCLPPLAPTASFARRTAALVRFVLVFALALATSGCGSFVARRMAQSPNTYPVAHSAGPR